MEMEYCSNYILQKNTNLIRYTTDGTNPNTNSFQYLHPIEIKNSQTIKAASFENEKQKVLLWNRYLL